MRAVTDDSLVKFSVGVLLTLCAALVGGATYLTNLSRNSESQTKSIEVLEAKVEQLGAIKTDIAVIRKEIESIGLRMDRQAAAIAQKK